MGLLRTPTCCSSSRGSPGHQLSPRPCGQWTAGPPGSRQFTPRPRLASGCTRTPETNVCRQCPRRHRCALGLVPGTGAKIPTADLRVVAEPLTCGILCTSRAASAHTTSSTWSSSSFELISPKKNPHGAMNAYLAPLLMQLLQLSEQCWSFRRRRDGREVIVVEKQSSFSWRQIADLYMMTALSPLSHLMVVHMTRHSCEAVIQCDDCNALQCLNPAGIAAGAWPKPGHQSTSCYRRHGKGVEQNVCSVPL